MSVPEISIELSPQAVQKLSADPRNYVTGTLREAGAKEYVDVAIKLKGAAGSFRNINDRPALTINVGKFADGRTWKGLKKFHLNNSVQDESLACEYIGSRLFAVAGIPTPRAAHARVRLNGRDLGFYVLKEGFDTRFLRRHFFRADGNLYDGGFCLDLDAPLERDEGEGPDHKRDLQGIALALRERDPQRRAALLSQAVDIERFITLMAMELMMGHWDGYTNNRNNYRVYFNPSNRLAYFFPHGLDQIFQDPNFGVLGSHSPMLASAVMGNAAWRKRYREVLKELLVYFEPAWIHAQIDFVARKLQPAMQAVSPGLAKRHADRIRELKNRVTARFANLRNQVDRPEPTHIAFNSEGIARLVGWRPQAGEDAAMEEPELDRRRTFSIRSARDNPVQASWRRRVLLARGTYLLEASIKTENVRGFGTGPRISGGQLGNKLVGSQEWTTLEYVIAIEQDQREVELVLELRAESGQVWFDKNSLLLRKLTR
jgi:hypothetical protein